MKIHSRPRLAAPEIRKIEVRTLRSFLVSSRKKI
jgi:hypothetical protein